MQVDQLSMEGRLFLLALLYHKFDDFSAQHSLDLLLDSDLTGKTSVLLSLQFTNFVLLVLGFFIKLVLSLLVESVLVVFTLYVDCTFSHLKCVVDNHLILSDVHVNFWEEPGQYAFLKLGFELVSQQSRISYLLNSAFSKA